MVAQRGLHIGDQGQDVGHSDIIARVEATAIDTPRAFHHPEMLAQITTLEIHPELLCPEDEERLETIDALVRIAIVPAIDQPNGLRSPVPVSPWMHDGVHRIFHLIQVANLLYQGGIVDAAHMRIQRAKQHRNAWLHSMDAALAQVKKARKVVGGDIGGIGVMLHLLVATGHRVGARVSNIVDGALVKQEWTGTLTEQEQDMHSLEMVHGDGTLQTTARQGSSTGGVADACPVDARVEGRRTAIYAQHGAWVHHGGCNWWWGER